MPVAKIFGRTVSYLGLLIGLSAGMTLLVWPLIALYAHFVPQRIPVPLVPTYLAVLLSLSLLGAPVYRMGRRLAQEPAEARLSGDRRPGVVLLRSFRSDGLLAEPHWRQRWSYVSWVLGRSSFEERLASVMDNLGPPVALGRPGEIIPTYGFARTYVADDNWQEIVRNYVTTGGWAVFILTHATTHLLWEIRTVQDYGGMKTLFVLPPREARTTQWLFEYEQIVAKVPTLGDATSKLAAVLCLPGEPPVHIEMDDPPSARTQLRAIREALVPRFL